MVQLLNLLFAVQAALHPVLLALTVWLATSGELSAQLLPQTEPYLVSAFPMGGRRGDTVAVEFRGVGLLTSECRLLIDGAPGISASDVQFVHAGLVRAQLTIADDAAPGRRMIRVHDVKHGATNYRYFAVGTLPEVNEQEPNNVAAANAQAITLPAVVNAKIDPSLDVDCFQFQASAGQPLVAAVTAHGLDGFVDFRKGFLDTSLTLRDAGGKVIAAAEDTVGLDPVLHASIPADGVYTLRVQSLNYLGSVYAGYRLTIGDVAYTTSVFPSGGQRGQDVEVELTAPDGSPEARQTVALAPHGTMPMQHFAFPPSGVTTMPLILGEDPEIIEAEPNDEPRQATSLALPTTANGRFLMADDDDWYKIRLDQGQGALLFTTAQRHLRSPVDTEVSVFDVAGKRLAVNDDGAAFGGYVQCAHDFVSNDSWLMFTAPVAGEYLIRVRDLNRTAGPRSVYRLTARPLEADFLLYQWPDAVPIWGPGTTASFVVEVLKWGGLREDVQVRVEGLPPSWQGSAAVWPSSWYSHYNGNAAIKLLLTITAPPDAVVGTHVPFRVVGRAEQGGRTIEREAQYMTLYGPSHNDRMHVRPSPQARAFVCDYKDVVVATSITEVRGVDGETVQIPVTIARPTKSNDPFGLVVNGPTPSAGCGWSAPISIPPGAGEFMFPLKLTDHPPGNYSIVIARSWASDTRAGRPGPCTAAIQLHILPHSAEDAAR